MCFHGTLAGCSKTGWAPLSWQGQASANAIRTEYMLQPMAIAEVLGLARLSRCGCASTVPLLANFFIEVFSLSRRSGLFFLASAFLLNSCLVSILLAQSPFDR